MKIAVLSGKGGTGKTMLSVNLAAAAEKSVYLDCDVEEPNGHLFFKPENIREETVTVPIPQVQLELCNGCRQCVDFCQYNALACVNGQLLIFEEVCHSCGGCVLFCPEKALTEKEKTRGKIQHGVSDNVTVKTGTLHIGEASGVPIIKRLVKGVKDSRDPVFIDCPPGSSCAVMESIKDADYCILTAEPTLFGVHNLNMVYQLVKFFAKPCGVVINKYLKADNPAERFCAENGIKVLGRIPFDQELGKMISQALIPVRERKKYRDVFTALLKTVMQEVQHEAAVNS